MVLTAQRHMNEKRVTLDPETMQALIDWANTAEKGKTTAYGPVFDSAMSAAQRIRDFAIDERIPHKR